MLSRSLLGGCAAESVLVSTKNHCFNFSLQVSGREKVYLKMLLLTSICDYDVQCAEHGSLDNTFGFVLKEFIKNCLVRLLEMKIQPKAKTFHV